MQTKQEKIEAELRMTDVEKVAAELMRMIAEIDEIDARIGEAEDVLGLRRSSPAERIADRLERIGVCKAGVALIERLFAMLDEVRGGTLSAETEAFLAKRKTAEESATRQLSAIVERASRTDRTIER
jgi:hypothetical protein